MTKQLTLPSPLVGRSLDSGHCSDAAMINHFSKQWEKAIQGSLALTAYAILSDTSDMYQHTILGQSCPLDSVQVNWCFARIKK